MSYHRERTLIWLASDPRIFRGAEIAEALTSTSLKRRAQGLQALYELASAERARLTSTKWHADQPLYNALAEMWRQEERLLLEAEVMHARQVA
jgi:hypothetical protein